MMKEYLFYFKLYHIPHSTKLAVALNLSRFLFPNLSAAATPQACGSQSGTDASVNRPIVSKYKPMTLNHYQPF